MRCNLTPPAFGKRDRDLARIVCWNVIDTMPSTLVPWHPHQARTRLALRSHGIATAISDTPARPHTHITIQP